MKKHLYSSITLIGLLTAIVFSTSCSNVDNKVERKNNKSTVNNSDSTISSNCTFDSLSIIFTANSDYKTGKLKSGCYTMKAAGEGALRGQDIKGITSENDTINIYYYEDGLVNKNAEGYGMNLNYLDIVINGERHSFRSKNGDEMYLLHQNEKLIIKTNIKYKSANSQSMFITLY